MSPVYREAANFDRTARAIGAQHRPPDKWIVVDDGSPDNTLEIARSWTKQLPFLTVIGAPKAELDPSVDGLALAHDARAFNLGLDAAGWKSYTHIGKLDGDVELPPHWFSTLLDQFRRDPTLGVTGGRLAENGSRGWEEIPIPPSHIHGAVKLYSRHCLEAIGGIPPRLGWDTIDETYARMHGFAIDTPGGLVARHHRHWGSASGRLRGRARHGDAAWVLHQTLPWAVLRAAKLARVPPVGLSGAAFLYGYVRAAILRTPRVEDPAFRRFVRRELRTRMLGLSRSSVRLEHTIEVSK